MSGTVYDYKRHQKSMDFGGDFEKWLKMLAEGNLQWLMDMLGLGDKGEDILAEIGAIEHDFAMTDWSRGEGLMLDAESQWVRIRKDEGERFPWLAGIYRDGIQNARKNQEDVEKRMELLNSVLENSREAEGNMEAMQSETEMRGLWNGEIERRNRLLSNLGLVQGAREKLKLDEERRAMTATERVMAFRVRDRNNMTEQDRAVGVKEGSGFRDF